MNRVAIIFSIIEAIENFSMLGYLAALVILLIVSGYFIFIKKSDKVEEVSDLDDGLIFDPETGAYITLEQAEKGYKLEDLNEKMVLGEEDINPEYVEYNKVKEYIDLNSFPEIDEFDQYRLEDFIKKQTNFNDLADFKLQKLKQIRPGIFIGLGLAVYEYKEGRQYEESDLEYQLVGFTYPELEAQYEKETFNKHITQKLYSLDIELSYLADEDVLCFKQGKPVTLEVFKLIENCLLRN